MRTLTLLWVAITAFAIAAADEPKMTVSECIANDARLEAKVALSLPLASLEEVVAQLASASGAKLYVRDGIRISVGYTTAGGGGGSSGSSLDLTPIRKADREATPTEGAPGGQSR
jgi:hypothetical protein